jgi:hypothetical protein
MEKRGKEEREKPEEQEEEEEDIPEDLFTMFMRNMMKSDEGTSSYDRYKSCTISIKIGSSLLSNKYTELKKKANLLLRNRDYIPKSCIIEFQSDEGYYSLNKTATTVHSSELEVGKLQEISKQCDLFLPTLIDLELEIINALVDDGILPKKRLLPEDILAAELQKEWGTK